MTQPQAETRPRPAQIERFLDDAGWGSATRAPLAGDASARRYERLEDADRGPAVLMDADPARGEDTRPFERVAGYLTELGLSAPRIVASDAVQGFLILEDLGDDLFARLAATDPGTEPTLYAAAVDLLAALHRHPSAPGLPTYGPAEMAPLAALATTWYAADTPGSPGADDTKLADACRQVLEAAAPETDVTVLRDFHAENLLWLPHRTGHARVGLLDFQDAGVGHRGYDLVSLLADARRDVTPDLRDAMITRYLDATGLADAPFRTACAALSAQRNLRILGVFARLSLRDGKPGYVDLIPRVWAHLQRDLAHPACAPLRAVADSVLPPPGAAHLASLRERAGTCPTR